MRPHRVLSLLLAGVISPSCAVSLSAQVPTPGAAADTSCTYHRCSLWLDAGRLVQGAEASVLARSGFFRPLRVVPFVAGDSARHYASLYERNARRATRLSLTALTLIAAGFVVGFTGDCPTFMSLDSDRCQDDAAGAIASILVLSGYTLEFIGIRISSRGYRSLVRALWWHNRQYAR